ncbi:MAG TPA: hypothetical protein PKG96_09285 [Bacilli bacterium]|nr:hypothetical protein [Bacilli bacterium]
MSEKLEQLKTSILADGIIDADEVRTINQAIYEDGKIDREEADFMFELNDAVSGKENHYSWKDLFVKAITDHVLKDDTSYGSVDDEEADYLIGKIQSDGKIDEIEQALLLKILEKATGTCEKFQDFVLLSFKNLILEDGVIDAAEVKTIKSIIYGAGGAGGSKVDKKEAEFLFELNDAVSGKANHESWKALMVEAISKYVLEDETSPNVIDDEEAEWLVAKIMKDGNLDEVEQAIVANIKSKAISISQKFTL